jgi:hypothetical protein
MANNYLQFSFLVDPGTEECRNWICDLLCQVDQDEFTDTFKSVFPDFSDTGELGFSWDISDEGLAIWAEESGDTESVVRFLKALLERDGFIGAEVGFTYASWCDSMRPGEFGGGAIRVYMPDDDYAAQVEYVDAHEWLAARQG